MFPLNNNHNNPYGHYHDNADDDAVVEEDRLAWTRSIFDEVDDVLQGTHELVPPSSSNSLYEPTPMASTGIRFVPQLSVQECWKQHQHQNANVPSQWMQEQLNLVSALRTTTSTTSANYASQQQLEPTMKWNDDPLPLPDPSASTSLVDFGGTTTTSMPSTSNNSNGKIRDYQEEQWDKMLERLKAFVRLHGHSNCPLHYKADPALGNWCKRQRYQYRKKYDTSTTTGEHNNHSTLTDERQAKLQALNFVWDSHQAAWDERYRELVVYHHQYGHVKVRSCENQPLVVWIKCQRRQYRMSMQGKKTCLTPERKALLDQIGFEWNPRGV